MIASAMVEPRACVVEVTRIVPAEDVPYVAARVAERLGMPLERVRKLIDDRTGPITRPLRPDKADAIAQTFEAAGVVVVIRPATEDDEDVASAKPPADLAAAAPEAAAPEAAATAAAATAAAATVEASPAEVKPAEPEPAEPEPAEVEPAEPSLSQPDVPGEPEVSGEFDEPGEAVPVAPPDTEPATELDADSDAESDAGLDHHDAELDVGLDHEADAERDHEPDEELDHEAVAERDAAFDAEPVGEPFEQPTADEAWDADEPIDDEVTDDEAIDDEAIDEAVFSDWFDGEAEGIVIEVPEDPGAGASGVAAEPERREHAGFVRSAAAAAAGPAHLRLEPEDEDDDTNDPGEFGLVARGEVMVRLPSGAYPAVDLQAAPWSAGEQGEHDRDDATERPAAGHDRAAGAPDERPRPMSPFGDPSTWHADDDPSGGWRINPRAGRRLEVVTDESTLAELADEPPSSEAHAAAAAGAPQTSRPAEVAGMPADTEGGTQSAEDDAGAGSGAEAEVHVPPAGIAERRTPPRLGRASRVPRPPGAAAPDRAVVAVPIVGAPGAADAAAATGPADADVEPAVHAVPTAWRGLGGDERGPARPVDARLPRRHVGSEHASVQRDAAAAVARRRTVMLVTLAIALALFVLAQAWVAGRAAPAFDAGLHRFRDADFGAAQRVWADLASAGDVNAQFMLGYLSEAGLGRPWSARAAASWYRLAADAGHAEAQWRLANLYAQGLGVPHEPVSAERWWAAAASGGHAEAAFVLGRSRLEGTSGPSDPAGALAAFERALALGWPAAAPYRDALRAVSGHPHAGALR